MISISDLFIARSKKLFWKCLPDHQVIPKLASPAFVNDQAHYVLRLREMYVKYARILWRKYYPVLHSYTKMGKAEEHAVAGPGQLRELGDSNLDRIVNLNHRLCGPTPYRGEEVEVLVGLYSVPGQDALKALVKTVGDIASLGGIALGQVPQIAELVKSGVESIVGLDTATLQLGIHDAFFKNNPLKPGVYVGVNAPANEVTFDQLWFKDGHLLKGRSPQVAKPYEDHDYMVLAVESHQTRDDWRSLPPVVEYEPKFHEILARNGPSPDEKRQQLGALWGSFQQAILAAPYLTEPDRDNIAASISADLNRRLKKLAEPHPFETRSFGEGGPTVEIPMAGFDLVDVEDRAEAGVAKGAFAGNPFR
jgi:hypothetical protein